jgi:hypothetical protein
VGNQLVARYKLVVGRRIQSATLVADARHSWLDALSSLGALVGLALVALGNRWGIDVVERSRRDRGSGPGTRLRGRSISACGAVAGSLTFAHYRMTVSATG